MNNRILMRISLIIAFLTGLNLIPILAPTGVVTVVTCSQLVCEVPKNVQVMLTLKISGR